MDGNPGLGALGNGSSFGEVEEDEEADGGVVNFDSGGLGGFEVEEEEEEGEHGDGNGDEEGDGNGDEEEGEDQEDEDDDEEEVELTLDEDGRIVFDGGEMDYAVRCIFSDIFLYPDLILNHHLNQPPNRFKIKQNPHTTAPSPAPLT